MATDALQSSSGAWPQVGNPPPSSMSPTDPNPEWEMIADDDNNNNNNNNSSSINDSSSNDHVVILPDDIGSSIQSNNIIKGRPRSATMGGQTPLARKNQRDNTTPATAPNSPTKNPGDTSIASSDVSSRTKHRKLRRCASTPDLLMSDNAHEVIVEDESDESTTSSSSQEEVDYEETGDVWRDLNENLGGESFEVLSDDNQDDNNIEPVMIDEDSDSAVHRCDEESATLVSTPSMDTSAAWTMTSEVPPVTTMSTTPSVWGMKKSPSFAEMLAKNINNDTNNGSGGLGTGGGWGSDKAKTESMLRDSHRKHHLRVKTKPKFIVTEDVGGGKTMKHAHSTGDLTKMLVGPEQERTRMFGQGRSRMTRKQLSDLMEEDDEGDFIIGRGSGGGGGGGGGGTPNEGDIMGDTDAMDFYHRKEKGSKGTSNKKKIRPDEAKRKEISMHKKEMQRQKQAESQKGGGGGGEKATGKKKNEKGFGGKKERRRL